MSDFLDKAAALMRLGKNTLGDSFASFENVFSAIGELKGVYAKSHLDLDNIEEFFGVVEMAVLLKTFAERDFEAIKALRNDVVTLIYKTLEICIQFPNYSGIIGAPLSYHEFVVAAVGRNHSSGTGAPHQPHFITFNYDLALDVALNVRKIRYDYGLDKEVPSDLVPLLKLHGSLNWGACAKCGKIVPYPMAQYAPQVGQKPKQVVCDPGELLPNMKCCDTPLSLPPVIVPPTWNKTDYRDRLSFVWQNAARVLAEAENVFIIGYSVPETDSFFRYLYALGSESKTRIKRFWVFDIDEKVEERFKRMIGGGIENRFLFRRLKFSDAIPVISRALEEA